MRIVTTSFLVIIVLVTHGCTSTAPPPEPMELQVDFSSGAQQYAAAMADSVAAFRSADDHFEVSGSMRLPNPCFEVKASGMAYPDSVVVTVEATPLPHMCSMAETTLPYEVIVHSKASEEKALRVRHTFTGADHLARTFQLGRY